jgi:hypothetical protein
LRVNRKACWDATLQQQLGVDVEAYQAVNSIPWGAEPALPVLLAAVGKPCICIIAGGPTGVDVAIDCLPAAASALRDVLYKQRFLYVFSDSQNGSLRDCARMVCQMLQFCGVQFRYHSKTE